MTACRPAQGRELELTVLSSSLPAPRPPSHPGRRLYGRMPIPTLFLLFATAWALFHLAKRSPAVRRRVRSLWRARPSPPTLGLDLATHLDDLDDDDESRWTVKTTLVGVQISTTVLNELPARLVGQLSDKSTTRLERAYDLGVVWGALGTLATVVILAWEGAGLAVWIIKLMSKSGGGPEVGRVVRRSIEETTTATASGPAFGQGIIQPLVSTRSHRGCSYS